MPLWGQKLFLTLDFDRQSCLAFCFCLPFRHLVVHHSNLCSDLGTSRQGKTIFIFLLPSSNHGFRHDGPRWARSVILFREMMSGDLKSAIEQRGKDQIWSKNVHTASDNLNGRENRGLVGDIFMIRVQAAQKAFAPEQHRACAMWANQDF